MRLPVAAAAALLALTAAAARAESLGGPFLAPPPAPTDEPVLVTAPPYRIESVAARFTYFDQDGLGYQSAAGPVLGPGSERATIAEPQSEVVAAVGDRLVERVAVSLDVVTAASPNHKLYGLPVGTPVDAISSPSRINEAEQIDVDSTYAWGRTTFGLHADYHVEEPLESWGLGAMVTRAFADDNTVLSASVFQLVDWFDNFDLAGKRHGRDVRSTTNANLGFSQLLSPTTIALVSYGLTVQSGTLTNTWNSVPLADGTRGTELVPRQRLRHAVSGRLVQWLPWEGALRLGLRYYADSWGSVARTVDAALSQRIGRLTLELGGRYHRQTAVDFFGTLFDPGAPGYRSSDSDLGGLDAWAASAGARWEQPIGRQGHRLTFALTGERYVRSNNLHVEFVSGALGWQL
ncbi:MAG TPA: DUF3570 domain-containing protein [Polyangia bacterium]|nr:DUF3570 domain-containing protein [Polyangia bacterium]